jgi:release factor glutamine methyltransferase
MSTIPLSRQIAERLPGETPGLDAQILLAHVTGHDRSWVLSHPEVRLTSEQEDALEAAIRRLQAGTPLPYMLGRWEFFGLDFEVTPDVLIPRPETELLVETALNWIRIHPQPAYRFLDVGTGSGCIAIALAVHVPRAETLATDVSPAALAVARRSAQRHGVQERIEFVECDLLPQTADRNPSTLYNLLSTINVLTANLPYIPTGTLKELAVYEREPTLALDGGTDGLELIRRLLVHLTGKMDTGCLILLEIESGQGQPALELAQAAFPVATVELKKDLAGRDRLVIIET